MQIVNYMKDLPNFRKNVYESFEHRRDALMELLDALTSNPNARSVALRAPHFHRQYSSVFDAIDNYLFADDADQLEIARRVREAHLINIIASVLPPQYSSVFDAIENYLFADHPGELTLARHVRVAHLINLIASILPPRSNRVWYFATDATSIARQHAATLEDRTYVYQANSVAGNKPVTIGHQYCTIAYLPAKTVTCRPWIVPMLIRRIRSCESETDVAQDALAALFSDDTLPWMTSDDLVVNVADSKYGTVPFLFPLSIYPNLLNITRIRANRVLYRLPEPVDPAQRKAGRPTYFWDVSGHAALINSKALEVCGVDLFLAGVERTMARGAHIGVHSWSDGTRDAADYPPEHEQNRKYIEDMLGDDAFYWFTIYAAPANGIYEMTEAEIEQYGLLTQPSPSKSKT